MNPRKKRTSWREIRQQRQSVEFVGRTEQLTMFRENLAKPVDDEQRRFIFNIWGQGGVGKTTLTKKFIKLAEEAGWATAYTDESENDVPGVLARLAKQFKVQGHELKKFDERYKVYRQKRQELEADPEAPQGFTSFAVGTLAKVGLKMGRRVPVGGALLEMVDEEAVATQAGQMAEFIRRKFTNRDEVQLLEDPENVLTPLFVEGLNDIAEDQPFVLFLDTYEQTGRYLDEWLRKLLDEEFGVIPPDFILVVAGRERLNRNAWSLFDQGDLITYFSIEPFSEQEVREYLIHNGVENEEVIKVILQLSGRLPLLVAMLAEGSPDDPKEVGEPSGTAVERFLKWVDDPKQRQFAIDAALFRELNQDTAKVLDAEHGEELLEWLIKMPFISERANGWMYHEVVRIQMLRHKRRESRKGWGDTHRKLANHYEGLRDDLGLEFGQSYLDADWQRFMLNLTYHRICQNPQEQFAPTIRGFLEALKEKREFARQWAEIMQIAGKDVENQNILKWAEKFIQGLDAYRDQRYEEALKMFTDMLEQPDILQNQIAIVLCWRGSLYRQLGVYEEALTDLNRSLEFDPEYIAALNNKGLALFALRQFEQAISQYTTALNITPNNKEILFNRGDTYHEMGLYENALLDIDQALALDPNNTHGLNVKGLSLVGMGQYENAIVQYTRIIELDPDYKWAFANRGRAKLRLFQFEDALADNEMALRIDPNYARAVNGKGLSFAGMEKYEQAIVQYNRALELNPEYHHALTFRAEANWKLQNFDLALRDIEFALKIEPKNTYALNVLGRVYADMEQYEEAIAQFNLVQEIYPRNVQSLVNLSFVYRILKQYPQALHHIDKAIELEPNYVRAIVVRGMIYAVMGEFDQAISQFNQALELNQKNIYPIANRGDVYWKQKKYELALLEYQRVIEITEVFDWIFYRLGRMYFVLDRSSDAFIQINRAIEINNEVGKWFFLRGVICQKLEQQVEAESAFQTCLKLIQKEIAKYPTIWTNRINLGYYYLGMGKPELALQQYEQIIQDHAPTHVLQQALEDLDDLLELLPELDVTPARTLLQNALDQRSSTTP